MKTPTNSPSTDPDVDAIDLEPPTRRPEVLRPNPDPLGTGLEPRDHAPDRSEDPIREKKN